MEIKRISYHHSHLSPSGPESEVLHFLDAQLRPNAGYSIGEEYPAVFGHYPGGESCVVKHEGRIVSHAAYLTREFRHDVFRMKIGLVGSVITSPEYRGQGIAKKVLTETIDELKRRGCVLALLWSGKPEFYRPLGFYRAGTEIDFRFTPLDVPSTDLPAVQYEESRHAHRIWRLYQKHDVRVDRSLEEQKRLCRIPKTQVFLTEREGVATSYIVIHKGADFQNYIHEWGGDIQDVAQNISWVQRNQFRGRNLTLIVPSHYDVAPIEQIARHRWEGVLGLMKVLHRPKLISCYMDYLIRREVGFSVNRRRTSFRFGASEIDVTRDEDLLSLVFGQGARPPFPALPFFLWGFDSI